MNGPHGAPLHVVAGVLRDARGRVLLAQRPQGKQLAGLWEFPGGKLEPGELPQQALARELHEELGIYVDPREAVSLIRIPWPHAGGRDLLLDAWQVTQWRGSPVSLEGQALQWSMPADANPSMLAPADRPVLQALRLPSVYAITPAEVSFEQAEVWHARVLAALERGVRLIQVRFPLWPLEQVRAFAARLQGDVLRAGACLLLNGDIEGARELGAGIGVHVTSAQLRDLAQRPLPWTQCIGASCHDAAELAMASPITDFATLSPIAPTSTHPHATPLGWLSFQTLAVSAALPVYALGGMHPSQAETSRSHGGQGVAGIGAFW